MQQADCKQLLFTEYPQFVFGLIKLAQQTRVSRIGSWQSTTNLLQLESYQSSANRGKTACFFDFGEYSIQGEAVNGRLIFADRLEAEVRVRFGPAIEFAEIVVDLYYLASQSCRVRS